MQDILEDFKDEMDKQSGSGRNEAAARGLADQFVADPQNDAWIAEIKNKSVIELVRAIDTFREAGMEEEVWKLEAYLAHAYEPQTIGTPPEPARRVVPEGDK